MRKDLAVAHDEDVRRVPHREGGEKRLSGLQELGQLGERQRPRRHESRVAWKLRLEPALAAGHLRLGGLELLLHLLLTRGLALVRGTQRHERQLAAGRVAYAQGFLMLSRDGAERRVGRVEPRRHVGDGASRVVFPRDLTGGEGLRIERVALGWVATRGLEERVHVRRQPLWAHAALGERIHRVDIRLLPEGLERRR